MLEDVARRILWTVFGSGANISIANPLPVTSEMGLESGTATGGSNTTLQDIAKGWQVNIWKDAILEVEIGGIQYTREIDSNTANTLDFATNPLLPPAVVVADGCPYRIKRMVSPMSPLPQANMHNVALVGMPANILVIDLTPINTPCLFRTQVAFDTAGVFSAAVTNGVPVFTAVTEFNHGVVLTANSLFMFDMLVHAGDSINFRYSLNAQMLVLRCQEIVAGVQ